MKGKASLYSYRDAETKDRFYLLHGDSLQELISYSQAEIVNGKRVLVPYNLFRGTLNQAFIGCPNEVAGTKNLPFSQKALIEIVARYNQCSAPASLTYVETPKKAVISWGVAGGGATSSLTVKGGPTLPKENETYSSSMGPAFGLFVNTTLPWINPKMSLQGEILYTRHQYSKSLSEQQNTFRKDYEVFFDLPYLRIPLLLRYTLPFKKIKPFVNAGIINSYAFNYKQEITTTSSSSVQENTSVKKEPFMEDFRNYAQSYAVGGGVLFPAWTNHQFSLEGRFERGNGFSRYTGISSTTSQVYLLLSLTL
ncbi:porin family protein [Rufibacter tibetensis]|uniref:Outer membrane protein beta-barrel domain-containing protein n=1 Tax=Rufibacter tibetensis TaxID=512763 RepID=A0A0P0CWS0_9BACT|nr:porin family protein [Rufibacter tibetensis]ALI99823.1 hypothetical protein DC20_13645 [Rufibacter tibetensis]